MNIFLYNIFNERHLDIFDLIFSKDYVKYNNYSIDDIIVIHKQYKIDYLILNFNEDDLRKIITNNINFIIICNDKKEIEKSLSLCYNIKDIKYTILEEDFLIDDLKLELSVMNGENK